MLERYQCPPTRFSAGSKKPGGRESQSTMLLWSADNRNRQFLCSRCVSTNKSCEIVLLLLS